jgi:hypothetical protein
MAMKPGSAEYIGDVFWLNGSKYRVMSFHDGTPICEHIQAPQLTLKEIRLEKLKQLGL